MIDNLTDFNDRLYIEDISLAYNRIKILPKLDNIRKLNISYNRIHSINKNPSSDILQSLDLNGNNISVLTDYVFANLTNLEYLYFGHNNLTSLPLHNSHNLKHLDLSFNQIKQIPVGFFNDLNELTYLDLSDNNMILDFNVLLTLKSLQTINIRKNKVQNFDSNILLSRFKFLKSITVSDDFWNCTELTSIIYKLHLKNIKLTPGLNRNYNILGITCKKEDTIKIGRKNDVAFYPAVEKIDSILNNTTFFKYLQIVAKHISDSENKSLDFSQNDNISINKSINYGVISLNILLAMILCCLIFSTCCKFSKDKL
ncbi:unnamed protein product [Ceutorhynchus assimilis]|uniref:Uncharacterized protein n=1 Tax=Ceutorhynchus assimilis TaxID=467358 RepID=A0A9N9QRX5_9CUCU|nr:unnamed protein product [Ceutorhynchus assimilis]